ncbi:3-phosphoshikimate 1-carboxyvinyltransferase [Limosilactobacillus fermentum]
MQKRALTINSRGLNGELAVPGDKSISHRALMIGALSEGTTVIDHFLAGEDCLITLRALQDLGVEIERKGEHVEVIGRGIAGLVEPAAPLQMNNSGTSTRLLMGILAGQSFTSQLVGDASLSRRPMKRVQGPLARLGAQIGLSEAGTLPATVVGHPLQGARVKLEVASAQIKSAVILAALQAQGSTTVSEPLPTRDHTERLLKAFGANLTVDRAANSITVTPGARLVGQEVLVPGDPSSAAFFLVAGAVIANSHLTVKDVCLNPTRTGLIRVLKKMGARLSIKETASGGEPLGDVTIQTSQLRAVTVNAKDVPDLIDELPLVALLAACADGVSEISGAGELRVKETDRIQTVAELLLQLGVDVEERPDGWRIVGRPNWQVQKLNLNSHGDHRLGMLAAVAALRSTTPLFLIDPDAVAVSYPSFFADLAKLGGA